MLRFFLLTLALAAAATPPVAESPPEAASARIAWIPLGDPKRFSAFEMDEARRVLYVARATEELLPTGGAGGKDATLIGYDVADPTMPLAKLWFQLGDVVPREIFPRFGRMIVNVWPRNGPPQLIVYDVRNKARPVVLGRVVVQRTLWVSADGLTVGNRTCFEHEVKCVEALDISTPSKPRKIADAASVLPPDFIAPKSYDELDQFERALMDRFGDYALSGAYQRFRLWRVGATGEREIVREIGDVSDEFPGHHVRLGADGAFALIERRDGIELISLAQRRPSAAGLREAFAYVNKTLGKDIERELKGDATVADGMHVPLMRAAALMENAGIMEHGLVDDLAQDELATMLLAYGRWLAASGQGARAVGALSTLGSQHETRESVELLARAALDAVRQSDTWPDKLEFSDMALNAAQNARARFGQWPKGVPDLEKLRIKEDDGPYPGVCDYVEMFWRAGRLGEAISNAQGADIANDGGETQFDVVRDRSDASSLTARKHGEEVYLYGDDIELGLQADTISALPYRKTTYVLYQTGSSVTLALAHAGVLCTFGDDPTK